MPKQPAQEAEEEDLFAAALALPIAERDGYLKRACGTNIDLLQRLKDLISAFGDAKSFVNEATAIGENSERIGPYQVLGELGEGGCGIAYLAGQTAPVKREVALKVIKPGMDTRAVLARFEAERQVLALLDHPNIAKVFDAGATPEGRPYFVMEVVRGIRITEYCGQSRLTISERLLLFVQVCLAIQHAHQKGIIHRDVKPSNVLVTMHDGLPLAKVIDFGIAKATQGRLIDQTLHTEIDQIIGTPAYISPEQLQPTQVAVDTRSDIYSLGVLLYELLTGHTPFDARELAAANIERLRERICTEQPVRPSRRLSSLDDGLLARVAIGSTTTLTRLVKQVREDLDWIVMQCLEKEPSRRYQTVNELVADLTRYLQHESVLARPPTLTYRIRKLARRNRIAFASALAAVAFVLFITGFAIIMTIQAQRISTERDLAEGERQQAQQVSNVALSILAIADPFQTYGSDVSGSALLEQAGKSIERELYSQPAARARLLQAVGRAYMRRAEFKPAIPYLKEAVRMLSRMHGGESETLATLIDLSLALRVAGDLNSARAALQNGEHLAKHFGLERSPSYAKLLLNAGRIELDEGRIPEARIEFEKSLELYRQVVGSRSAAVAEVLADLSATFTWTDELTEAERIAREAIAIFEHTVPAMHPDRVRAESSLADALYLQNRPDEAAHLLASVLRKETELFGHRSPQVADVLDRLAMVRYSQRRFDEAERFSREAATAVRFALGDRHAMTASMDITLARTLTALGKYPEAEATLRQALQIFANSLPPNNQHIASAEYFLGEVLLATNRPGEAEAVLTASMNRWERSGAPHWRALRSASALGEALYRQGRMKEAEKYLSDSFRDLSTDPKAEFAAKDKARQRVARYMPKSLPPLKAVAAAPLTVATQ